MRLIDADALLEFLKWEAYDDFGNYNVVGQAIADAPTIESSGDLISRETLIGAIEKCGEDKVYSQALIETIKALPSADRPKGEWIDEDGDNVPLDKDGCPLRSCYCNQCHEWLVASDEYGVNGNFCPSCGADMRCDYDSI